MQVGRKNMQGWREARVCAGFATLVLGGCGSAGTPVPHYMHACNPCVTAGTPTPSALVRGVLVGTRVQTITYASPAPGEANSYGSYSFVERDSATPPRSGAVMQTSPVQRSIAYAVVQRPTAGTVLVNETIFETGTYLTDSAEALTLTSSSRTTTGIELTSLAGGPFTIAGPLATTETEDTEFAAQRVLQVNPAPVGTTITNGVARKIHYSRGPTSSNGANADIDLTTDVNPDGSYTETGWSPLGGVVFSVQQDGDGSSHFHNQAPGFYLLDQVISAPQQHNGAFAIPVSTAQQGRTLPPTPTVTPALTSARDWYPGGALPMQPLETDTTSVSGPLAPPTVCGASASATSAYEFDEQHVRLETAGRLTTEEEKRFVAAGATVCRERTATVQSFDPPTGSLTRTDVDTTVAHLL